MHSLKRLHLYKLYQYLEKLTLASLFHENGTELRFSNFQAHFNLTIHLINKECGRFIGDFSEHEFGSCFKAFFMHNYLPFRGDAVRLEISFVVL